MFNKPTQTWFDKSFKEPTQVQSLGWRAIRDGHNALLVAPTGSGKTLAAFLSSIDRLGEMTTTEAPGVRVLYVSPLKALVYDIERNLRSPLIGIARTADHLNASFRPPGVAIRTGDTPQKERQRQLKSPSEILVTTPESLYLILGSKAALNLRTVNTVIIDEVHALAATKRGTHLALSLERLSHLTESDPQRIGLSATVRPLENIAAYLGGDRDVKIIDTSSKPNLELTVTVPVPDMQQPVRQPEPPTDGSVLSQLYSRDVGTPPAEKGIWPAIYPQILSQIRNNRSTIVFVNSRGLCERLAQKLNELADEELVFAHHGSLSHERRAQIEDGLKSGAIKGIVATSSLELGVDMGSVDEVILVESPGSVARGLQRVGRAGHQVDAVSVGRVYPKFRGDLLECAVVANRMLSGDLEAISVPTNPLDILAQQVVAICAEQPMEVDALYNLVVRSAAYRNLSRQALEAVLDMLTGRYPSADFADLRPLLTWDRTEDTISPRRGAAMVARLNGGTIPDRGSYAVNLGEDGPRLGELDEEMVFETRPGDNIMLGASTWRVESILRDRVIVAPAPGEPGRLPFWRGDGPGRPMELGHAIGRFVRKAGNLSLQKALGWVQEQTPLDNLAAKNLVGYIHEQKTHTGVLPTDRSITVERFRDELGDWRICILTPFGSRIHAPWALCLQNLIGDTSGYEIQVMYTDDGIVLRFADAEELPDIEALLPRAEEVEELLTNQLAGTALFAGLFRENAARALLLRKKTPGKRSPLWAQRLKAQNLLATVSQYPSFPVVVETYRQALADVFDLPGFKRLLDQIRDRHVLVDQVETKSASPFAKSLVFAYVAAYLYEQDAPMAERKAQALTLDKSLLGELLGQAELRELLDADVLVEVETELQLLPAEYHARDADELHDVLRRLGDLSVHELEQRAKSEPIPWLKQLETEKRALSITINGEDRWIAAQDASLYRDALGVNIPPGLPDAFLEPQPVPVQTLLRRFARHHGPFLTEQPAVRYGFRQEHLEPVLVLLEKEGHLVRGEIRPGGAALDWCDTEILRRIKRRTLAQLRNEVAPVEAASFSLFLQRWHGLNTSTTSRDQLVEAITQLQGLPVSWKLLSTVLLPKRVRDFRAESLDILAASGLVVWVGKGSLGSADGRVAIYLRNHARDLITLEDYDPPTPLHQFILSYVQQSGASFFMDIQDAARQSLEDFDSKEFKQVMWDLVWAGQLSNDTFAPLQGLNRQRRSRRGLEAMAGGRWSLVRQMLRAEDSPTKQTVARANMLLERYGVVSRDCLSNEDMSGGFGPLYRVFKEMEDKGQVRRGYFVEGLNGAQFAHVGAVDRLRACRSEAEDLDAQPATEDEIEVLSSVDPTNPFGALLPWPEVLSQEKVKPRRVVGSWVVLVRGVPVFYVGQRGKNLITFSDALQDPNGLDIAIDALRRIPRFGRRGFLVIEKINGTPAADSDFVERFMQHGFSKDYRGLIDLQGIGHA